MSNCTIKLDSIMALVCDYLGFHAEGFTAQQRKTRESGSLNAVSDVWSK